MKDVRGAKVVAIANDKQDDYKSIRENVGVLPMTFTTYYKIFGDDAEEKLDYLLTKSVQYLNYGQNRLCYMLQESGEVEAFITIYKNDESFMIEAFNWDCETIEKVLGQNDISFEKLDYSCILLEGVNTINFMADAMELTVDYFVYQSHVDSDCLGKDVIIARTGYTAEFGYKIIGLSSDIEAIWAKILPEHKDKVVGYDAFEMCFYEVKQPSWELSYLSLSPNVFEIDYQWFVDFKKDTDYVGKDNLFNAKFESASKRLIGALSDAEIAIGSEVVLEGEIIGKVVDSRLSYGLNKYIHMLFVEKEYNHANVTFNIDNQEVQTMSAPYIFPDSWYAGR